MYPSFEPPPPYSDTADNSASLACSDVTAIPTPPRALPRFVTISRQSRFAPKAVKLQLGTEILRTGPSFASPATNQKEQLRRYMLELLGFTFGVDFVLLNAAYYNRPIAERVNSLLSPIEHANLFQLSLTIARLRAKVLANELNTTSASDKKAIHDAIVGHLPVHLSPQHTIDLIETYCSHQCDPTKWKDTLIGYWRHRMFVTCLNRVDWLYTLGSHARLIEAVAPNERVQQMLEEALEAYQREWGLTSSQFYSSWEPEKKGTRVLQELLMSQADRMRGSRFVLDAKEFLERRT